MDCDWLSFCVFVELNEVFVARILLKVVVVVLRVGVLRVVLLPCFRNNGVGCRKHDRADACLYSSSMDNRAEIPMSSCFMFAWP